MKTLIKILTLCLVPMLGTTGLAQTSTAPLRIEVTQGVIEPLPFAAPQFVAENSGSRQIAAELTRVIVNDLVNSGLFREIPTAAHISKVTNFDAPIPFSDWSAINAQALITGSVNVTQDARITVKFRLFDVFAQATLGDGQQYVGNSASWRRMAHKVADEVYKRLTGEPSGYFDSRVVFISESGPKNARLKRLAVMDYDGANLRYLTNTDDIVLAPRFSPNAREIIYTSYETGQPKVFLMNVDTLSRRALDSEPGMTFAPRFSPDGRKVVMSLSRAGNTDIYSFDIATGQKTRLTTSASIDTAPSFSPDGSQIVFESDRGGGQQIYVMPAEGGQARRVSRGKGRYGTPVWSPRGDKIAFTNMRGGRFHIGVMGIDGGQERLLSGSFLDEGPTWSPNGRVIMFFRETAGANGAPALYSVDITGQNLRKVPTPGFASDPAWSGLLE